MSTDPLRLKWAHTWPEGGSDFIARDPAVKGSYCRVHLSAPMEHTGTPWAWTASDGRWNLGTGYEATQHAAARAAEKAYFAGKPVANIAFASTPRRDG